MQYSKAWKRHKKLSRIQEQFFVRVAVHFTVVLVIIGVFSYHFPPPDGLVNEIVFHIGMVYGLVSSAIMALYHKEKAQKAEETIESVRDGFWERCVDESFSSLYFEGVKKLAASEVVPSLDLCFEVIEWEEILVREDMHWRLALMQREDKPFITLSPIGKETLLIQKESLMFPTSNVRVGEEVQEVVRALSACIEAFMVYIEGSEEVERVEERRKSRSFLREVGESSEVQRVIKDFQQR